MLKWVKTEDTELVSGSMYIAGWIIGEEDSDPEFCIEDILYSESQFKLENGKYAPDDRVWWESNTYEEDGVPPSHILFYNNKPLNPKDILI